MNATRYAVLTMAIFSAVAWGQAPAETQASTGHTFSPAQLTEIEARDQLSRTIAGNAEADAQTHTDQEWRMRLMSSLYRISSPALRSIAAQAHTVDQAQAMAGQAFKPRNSSSLANAKALNDVGDDLVYTPMTPCRFIDTRNVGGVIPTGSSNFTAFDSAKFGSVYGGVASCFLPAFAGNIAIAANVTVVVTSGAAGFLGIRPHGSTTRSSLINWPTGGTPGLANAAIISAGLDTSSGDYLFEAYAGNNTPYLVVDFFGYFAPAAPTALNCISTGMTTISIAANSEDTLLVTACPTGYTIVAPLCEGNDQGTVTFLGTEQYNTSPTATPSCAFYNTAATAQNAIVGARCCRVP